MTGPESMPGSGGAVSGSPASASVHSDTVPETFLALGAIVDRATESIALIDLETGRFLEFNRAAHERLGYAREELLALTLWDIEEAGGSVRAALPSPENPGETLLESRHRTRDGRIRDVGMSMRVVQVRGRACLAAIWSDITDRKRAELELDQYRNRLEELVAERTAELRDANERLRLTDLRLNSLFALSQEAGSLDEPALLARGAEIAVRLTGSRVGRVDPADAAGSRLLPGACWNEVTGLEPDPGAPEISPVGAVLDEARLGARPVIRALRSRPLGRLGFVKGRESPWARVLAVPISAEGRVRLTLCVGGRPQVYTDRDAGELERIGNDLWVVLARRRAELELAQAKDKAESASRAKTELLANMSHEIRTPLNTIVGLSQVLADEREEARQREHAGRISVAARHLLAVFDDILDLSRIESGRLRLESTDFDLKDLTAEALAMVHPRASAKGLTLSVDLDPAIGARLRGDPLRLRQILLNLLANAVKFTEQGSVALRGRLIEPSARPDVSHEDEALQLRFEVEDTGIGIDPAEQGRLFEPFEQIDGSVARRFGGTGLGLAICRRLVRAMDGELGVASDPGIGSTFWFTVRLERGGDASDALLARETRQGLRGRVARVLPDPIEARVLVVDDRPLSRKLILALLGQIGVSAEAVESGEQALERVEKADYDLILMDAEMTVLNGFAAIRLIRGLPGLGAIPIVAMNAPSLTQEIEVSRAAGVSECIGAPISRDTLCAVIARWLPTGKCVRRRPQMQPDGSPQDKPPELWAIPGVRVALGLRSLGGDQAQYLDLLWEMVRSHQRDGARLCALLDQGVPEQARGLACELKGVAGALGATRIQALAAGLDAQLREGDMGERTRRIADSLGRELAGLGAALEALPTKPGATATDADPESVDSLLDRIAALLRADDMAALRVYEASRSLLRRYFGDRGRVLEELVRSFDFPQAALVLETLRRAEEPLY